MTASTTNGSAVGFLLQTTAIPLPGQIEELREFIASGIDFDSNQWRLLDAIWINNDGSCRVLLKANGPKDVSKYLETMHNLAKQCEAAVPGLRVRISGSIKRPTRFGVRELPLSITTRTDLNDYAAWWPRAIMLEDSEGAQFCHFSDLPTALRGGRLRYEVKLKPAPSTTLSVAVHELVCYANLRDHEPGRSSYQPDCLVTGYLGIAGKEHLEICVGADSVPNRTIAQLMPDAEKLGIRIC